MTSGDGTRIIAAQEVATTHGDTYVIAAAYGVDRRLESAIAHTAALGLSTEILEANQDGSKVFAYPPGPLIPGAMDAGPSVLNLAEPITIADLHFNLRVTAYQSYLASRKLYYFFLLLPLCMLLFGALGAVIDYLASRLNRAEMEKRRFAEELERFFTIDLDLFCIADTGGRLLRSSPAWTSCLGYSQAELEGRSISDFASEADRGVLVAALNTLKTGGSIDGSVFRFRSKCGLVKKIEWRMAVQGSRIFAAARDVTGREEDEDLLRRAIAQKDTLLREVHHRVKNNLQIIASLLRLQADQTEDPLALETFEEAQNRVIAMALVHETLYQSHDLASIDFFSYIENVLAMYHWDTGNPSPSVEIRGRPLLFNLDLAIPCGLLVNEIINNAVKHAFHGIQHPLLTITIEIDDYLSIVITDNGPGFPPDFDPDRDSHLGLKLIKTLVEQLRGVVAFRNCGGGIVEVRLKPKTGSYAYAPTPGGAPSSATGS